LLITASSAAPGAEPVPQFEPVDQSPDPEFQKMLLIKISPHIQHRTSLPRGSAPDNVNEPMITTDYWQSQNLINAAARSLGNQSGWG
jgi:hypothetical protein